jgi:serine/threonine protein kinase
MGLAKRLDSGQHSFSSTNAGSAGWQAPELLANERQTKSVDIFALGCIIFYILTDGQHPFGNKYGECEQFLQSERERERESESERERLTYLYGFT